MTEATPLASEQITQEDREAAASNIKRRLVWQHGGEQQWMDASTASMRMGEQDHHDEVQAFARHRIAALSASPAPSGQGALKRYDAGLLGDGGGGDVEWWQDYLRAELERAHDFYADQWEIQS